MRRFEHFRAEGDGMSFLVEVIDGEGTIVLSGDDYHDKIGYRIGGFLEGIEEYDEVKCEEYWVDIEDESDFHWEEARTEENKR